MVGREVSITDANARFIFHSFNRTGLRSRQWAISKPGRVHRRKPSRLSDRAEITDAAVPVAVNMVEATDISRSWSGLGVEPWTKRRCDGYR